MISAISKKLADSWPLKSALADANTNIQKRGRDKALAEKIERTANVFFSISMLFFVWLAMKIGSLESDEIINAIALMTASVAAIWLGRPWVLIVLFASLVAFPLVFAPLLPAASAYVSALVEAFPLAEIALATFLFLLGAYFQNLALLLRNAGGEE